jgi:hypothetical protein
LLLPIKLSSVICNTPNGTMAQWHNTDLLSQYPQGVEAVGIDDTTYREA